MADVLAQGCGIALGTVVAKFDSLVEGRQQWDIIVDTIAAVSPSARGALLGVDGSRVDGIDQEYPRLHDRFADLIASRMSDVAPLRPVADAYLLASRKNMPELA